MSAQVPHLGIDLGTTNSCIAYYDAVRGVSEVIPNKLGNRTTPSQVAMAEDGRKYIGTEAISVSFGSPQNTVYDTKRMIGKNFSDKLLQSDTKRWPFTVVRADGDMPRIAIKILGKTELFTPETFSALILGSFKSLADARFNTDCTDVVVTVPAYFESQQRSATKLAATLANFKNVYLFNEPTAAALAYGFQKLHTEEGYVFVFDFGGGTLDASILKYSHGEYESKGVAGDTHLGGQDIDNILVKHFADRFLKKKGINLYGDDQESMKALKLLKKECEKAKITLSTLTRANIIIDDIKSNTSLEDMITRAEFDNLISDILFKCEEPIKEVLLKSGIEKDEITDLIIVGGSSRIPAVKELLRQYFDKVAITGVDADEAVALGASLWCYKQHSESSAPFSRKSETISRSSEKLSELKVIESTSLSIGIRTKGGRMETLIPHSVKIPFSCTKQFSTTENGQTEADIIIYEGERLYVDKNTEIGRFCLRDLPPNKAGVVKFFVTISISADNITTVSAKLSENQSPCEVITISDEKRNFSQKEIDEMIKDSNKWREADNLRIKYETIFSEFCSFLNFLGKAAKKNNDIDASKEANEAIVWVSDNNDPSESELAGLFAELNKKVSYFQNKYGYFLK